MTPEEYAADHIQDFEDALISWLMIPSISTQRRHKADCDKAAQHLQEKLQSLGAKTELLATPGHPAVYGEIGTKGPTILLYGHYDVQPPEPLRAWTSPPFAPERTASHIIARGASDDKGQVWMHLAALESFIRTKTPLPCRIKFLIEGEEEIGSPHLPALLEEHADRLSADVVVVSDTAMPSEDQPSLTVGTRGMAGFELTIQGPKRDLHSGEYGGVVHNPLHVLARMIASLHDEQGVCVAGFPRAPVHSTQESLSAEDVEEETGIPPWTGEHSLAERRGQLPTIDVNGMWGGYTEDGFKTVIPATASAKITMRLVNGQDPASASAAVKEHLERALPAGFTISYADKAGAPAFREDQDAHPVRLAAEVLAEVYGRPAVMRYSGGSLPILNALQRRLQAPIVCLGFGLPSDRIHSPNERFSRKQFRRGIQTIITYWQRLAKE